MVSDMQRVVGPIEEQSASGDEGQRFIYEVEQGTWRQMVAELLHEVTFDAGSLEEASARLGLNVSELEAWKRWSRGLRGGVRAAYFVPVGPWAKMRDGLLLSIVRDAGSIRKAAKSVDVPKSTLAHWVRRAGGR